MRSYPLAVDSQSAELAGTNPSAKPPAQSGLKRSGVAAETSLMKLIFFSHEPAEIELVRNKLLLAGIPCEVHKGRPEGSSPTQFEVELKVQNDQDAYRAVMLCVELDICLAKRWYQPKDLPG